MTNVKIIDSYFILKILGMVRNFFKSIAFKFFAALKIKMGANKLNKRIVINNTHDEYLFSQSDIFMLAYGKMVICS